MKYTLKILTTLAIIAVFILAGCDNPSDRMNENEISETESTQEMVITANEKTEEIRVFRLKNSDRFKEFNRTISNLERQIQMESDVEVKERLETRLEELKETQSELKHEIDNFQASKSDDWDEFKDNFSYKMDDFSNSLNDFFPNTETNTSPNNQL